jgi:hypothetical protein
MPLAVDPTRSVFAPSAVWTVTDSSDALTFCAVIFAARPPRSFGSASTLTRVSLLEGIASNAPWTASAVT